MMNMESCPSKVKSGAEYDFYVECPSGEKQKQELVEELNEHSTSVNVLSRDPDEDEGKEK